MGNNVLKPISCKQCGNTMQWQITKLEKMVHCVPCRRAVVVMEE